MLIQKTIIQPYNWPVTSQLYIKRTLDSCELEYLEDKEEEYNEQLSMDENGQFILYSTYSNHCTKFTVYCGRYFRNYTFIIGPQTMYSHSQTLCLVATHATDSIVYKMERI